jgi:hypothetical protein
MDLERPTGAASAHETLPAFRDIARVAGYIFGGVGFFFFFLTMCSLARGLVPGWEIAEAFRCSGALLTVSWLLLRFGSGLFPFGMRLFG